MNDNYGVITEQGFVSGEFGFNKLKEEDKKVIKESERKEKDKDHE